MTLSTRNAVAAILVAMLARPAPIRAQETGSASAENTASAQAPSTTEDEAPAPEADLVEFAKTLPMFWPDKRMSMAGEAIVLDVERGTRLRSLRRYGDSLRHVRFSPDCTLALLSLYDKCLLWNLGNGEVVREFEQGGIAHFSPDGSSILIYGDYRATRYEAATGEVIETIQLPTYGSFKNRHTRINAHLDNEVYHDASGRLCTPPTDPASNRSSTAQRASRLGGARATHDGAWPPEQRRRFFRATTAPSKRRAGI